MNIDINKLRKDLIDYFGSAMFNGFPVAMMDLSEIERAGEYRLIEIAKENGFDLNNYITRSDEER